MATEDEAREVADGEEVQVEAGDLGTTHLRVNVDSKLSSHGEMKEEATVMDSTEGLKVSEDQVLERAPSVVQIPQEDTPNGTHASLNGHMKEGKISNEKPQENGQKDNEQVEASPDRISTDQSSTSNAEEAIDSLGHVENTAEDTSLLKHDNEEPKEHCQQDVEGAAMEDKMVHEETLQPDNDVAPTIDAQQGHNLQLAEVTEDTQPATMPCIPREEVVAEAPAGVQTSLEPNVDEPDAVPDTSDGDAETGEPAKVDKENCPLDEDTEVVKLGDQPSDLTDDVDADVVQEEVPKSKKPDAPEDMPKTEQADESTNGDQEVLNQESPEETSDPLHEKTEETSHESNVSTSEETTPEHDAMTREPALDVEEVQNQGLAEEIADAKEVDTEKTVQQSGIAFEEATPEDNTTIIEPSSGIQHLNNVESEKIKGLEDAKAEETSNQSNVTIAEDATQDKEATEDIQPVQGLEEEEPKDTGTVEMDEASNEQHADVINNLAEEDGVPACQPEVIELKEEVKDTGATDTQEITQQSHAAASEELVTEDNSMAIEPLNDDIQQTLEQGSAEVKDTEVSETQEICHERTISAPEEYSVEDDVTAEGPTCDAQEVENVALVEEIKDNTAQNIIETPSVATVEEADQENDVLPSEDVSEQQMLGLETEEIQNTEPVETEEASDQRHPALLSDPAKEDSIPSDVPKTGSTADMKEIEATTTEALPQESNVSISREPASEENITASEVTCDEQQVNLEQAEGARPKDISDQSNEVFAREATQGTSDLARETAVDMQSVHELQSEKKKNAKLTEVSEASGQMDAAVIENPTHEDNLTTSESLVMESAEVSSNEATEGHEMPQSDATQSEDHKAEENMAASEPQILEPEPAEEMRDSEATEPRAISQESMSVPEDVTAKEAASDIRELQTEELIEKPDGVKAEEISNQSSGTIVGETAQEHKLLSSDPTSDGQAKELESQKIGGSEDVQTEEAPHQTHTEENLTENEPQIATEDNTAILTDVSIQQLQEQEPVEFRDTEATEPQGICPSHKASGSEQSTPEDNEMTEPSPATQAENLESAIVTEESKDVKSTDAIVEEETPKEHVQESEAHVDIPPVENTEPANDLPAEKVKDNEAIEVAEIHYESPVANIGDLTEDAKSNVALEDEAAPDEDAKATGATAAIPQPREPELEEIKNSEAVEVEGDITAMALPAEEIKDTEAMETEMIPHESTGANISELINDVKTNIALADEAAPDKHAKATAATGAIPQPQEPDLEEIKNSEPAEVGGNTSASVLPAENVKDTEVVETEAINESTDADNSELTEDVQSNVALTDEAAHDELVKVAERTVDIPQAEEPKLKEIKNTEPVEVEENRSASDLPAEEVKETEAINKSSDANISDLIEDVQNNVALADETAPEEHVIATEATVDIPEAQETELEETKNTEPAEVEENISANDLPVEEVKDTEVVETEAINESTDANNSELTEDVKNNVALADKAALEEHVTVGDDTVDIPQGQEPEVEEIKNTEPVEVEENISASDLPAEEVNKTEAKETEAIIESTDANWSELTEDVKSNVALADEATPEEHVRATEATVDIPRAPERELEEIKNTEPVEVEENISASDMPGEVVKDTEAKETEAINESTDANISELTEDVKSNVASADEAAPEEHVIATATTVDIPRAQEPELEETKNTEPAEVEVHISENDLPAEEVKDSEAVETEAMNESTDADNSDLNEDVKSNVALADEEAPEEHVTVADDTVDIPQAQEPEVEEIKNTEPVEVEENISASVLPAEEVKGTEAVNESTDANISELTEDVKSNVIPADEAAPEEHVIAAEAIVDIPQAQVPELQELENVEPVEVEENRSAGKLPAEEVKETEAINESIDANISELTKDVTSNVTPADEAAPEEYVTATEATVDIPRAQEPELEEIKNTEAVEVEENTSASDMPAEEVKDTEAKGTEAIDESTDANISELTEDMKSNVALTDEAAHEEHVTEAETTVDIPQAQEPEQEEIRNTEAGDLPAEEVKETEEISERTDAKISELNEDVKSNVALADEEPHAEHVTVAETTVDIPQAQEPELKEIKNTERVEVEENRSASDLQVEEVKETEAINESPDANISELTEDVTSNVAPANEAAPEERVIATEATVDVPRALEPDLEEIKNTEPVEVEENISASDLPAEEVKETETKETEAINESTDANISELTEDEKGNVAHADEAAPEEHLMAAEATDDIPQAQVPELQELENAESVEVEENKSAADRPGEVVKDTETMETEAVNNSTDANISELTEDVALADKVAPDVQVGIPTTQEPALEEIKNTEPVEAEDSITAVNVPAEEINDTEAMQTGESPPESTDDGLTASAPLPDIQQVPEQEVLEEKTCTDTTENRGEPQQSIDSTSAELTPTEEETTVVEHTQDTHVQNASSELGSDPNLLVQSAHQSELAEDSKGQLVKAEETGQSNGATLGEPTAEDNAANEINPLADSKQEHELESLKENKCIDATEGEEASHPCQDPGLEEPVSESDITTVEPTSDIQQVNGMDAAEEMTATEGINDEETSTEKTEVATLEDPSPTDNGTEPEQNPVELDKENLGNEISNAILADENIKEEVQEPIEQKDESSDLGEKSACTTKKDESATEEDVVQISGEDTVGASNSIEQIKEQPKSVIEHGAIKSGDHTNDQDDKQLHNEELQMQVCERSVDVLTTEQPDEHVQKVNLDQQQKEDEAIEKQTEEIQIDEQKHDDSRADFTTETMLEPQSNEIDTTNRKDDADVFEAEQTETVTTEMLKNEQTLHIPQESIPSIADAKVDNSTEIEETTEQADAPNNTGTLYTDADAEKYNEDEKENTDIDAAVANSSTDEQDGTTDETINEEDPTVVPQNVESTVHSEEKECINKANDGMRAIQASEEEIVDEVEKKEEIQNEDTDVNHEETETKPVDEEVPGQNSNNSTDTKMDDTMSPNAEMIHERIDARPTEIEEAEENKGFSSISEYDVEKSKQNDVERDLSIHPKIVDDKLAREQNGAEVETDSNEEMATGYTAVTESVKLGEAIYDKASRADGALSDENLETTEDNRRNLEASPAVTASGESMNEDNEHHKLALPSHSAVDGNETEQASGLEVTERELFPEKPLPTESEEQEGSQITKEQDEENVQEQETGDTEKEEKEAEQSDLPVSNFLMNLIMGKQSNEPDGKSEFEVEKKQEETTKDESSLITSQQEESLVPIPTENKVDNEHIFEQEKHNLEGSGETHDVKLEKDEELNRNTRDLEAPVCQNNVQGESSSELVPGESGMITEMETRDVKLGEKPTNSVCQEHMEATTQVEEGCLKSNLDDITSPKTSQEDTIQEGRTDLRHEPLPENRSSDAVSGQTFLSTEPTMGDEKNFPNDTDDLPSPLSTKREDSNEPSITEAESTVETELENGVDKEEENQQTTTTGGTTEEELENAHDISQKGAQAISDEQKGEITEPVMSNDINLVHEKGISAGSECNDGKQSYKYSNSELDNSEKASEIQLDGSSLHIDQDKQDESAGDQIVMEKTNLLDKPGESNLQKEQEVAQKSPKESDEGDQNSLAIREPVIKEVNINKTVDSHVQTVSTQSHEEQETFNSQVQERALDVASPEKAPEAEEKFVESKTEFSTVEEQSPKKDESNMAGEKTSDEKTKDVQEAKSFTDEAKAKIEEQGAVRKASHNQTRHLDVVSPTEAPGSEENFVDIKEPEFSTDEEESPKKDVSNMAEEKSYDKKTNGNEEAKNFTDDAPMKIEEREAGQKASPKKHNILSGVGSKVKHQLAKVRKAIIGKPGHTKSELPKA